MDEGKLSWCTCPTRRVYEWSFFSPDLLSSLRLLVLGPSAL